MLYSISGESAVRNIINQGRQAAASAMDPEKSRIEKVCNELDRLLDEIAAMRRAGKVSCISFIVIVTRASVNISLNHNLVSTDSGHILLTSCNHDSNFRDFLHLGHKSGSTKPSEANSRQARCATKWYRGRYSTSGHHGWEKTQHHVCWQKRSGSGLVAQSIWWSIRIRLVVFQYFFLVWRVLRKASFSWFIDIICIM